MEELMSEWSHKSLEPGGSHRAQELRHRAYKVTQLLEDVQAAIYEYDRVLVGDY